MSRERRLLRDMPPGTDTALAPTLVDLGADLIHEIFLHVDLRIAFKLTCTAVAAGWTEEGKIQDRYRDIVCSPSLLAWAKHAFAGREYSVEDAPRGWFSTDYLGFLAAMHGYSASLAWLRDHSGYEFRWKTCTGAAKGGQLQTLQWLREQGCPWDETTTIMAAKMGHHEMLEWLLDNGCLVSARACEAAAGQNHMGIVMLLTRRHRAAMHQTAVCAAAAEGGHGTVLAWLQENGYPIDDTVATAAARGGHIGPLHLLEMWGETFTDVYNNCRALSAAASKGHLHVVQWLHERDFRDRNGVVCISAAHGGHLKVLQWLRANEYPWYADVCSAAAEGGHFELIQWAVGAGCEVDEEAITKAAEAGHLHIVKWLREEVACPWNGRAFVLAAGEGEYGVMAYMLAQDPDVVFTSNHAYHAEEACAAAAGDNRLKELQWLREHGLPWDDRVCTVAACNGFWEVLKWARNNGCPWSVATCTTVAARGRLGILKYLRSQGCPWDNTTTEAAASKGRVETLKWVVRNGCPFNAKRCSMLCTQFNAKATLEAIVELTNEEIRRHYCMDTPVTDPDAPVLLQWASTF